MNYRSPGVIIGVGILVASASAGNITIKYANVYASKYLSYQSPFTDLDSAYTEVDQLLGPAVQFGSATCPFGSVNSLAFATAGGVNSATSWFNSGDVQSYIKATNNGIATSGGYNNGYVGGVAHGAFSTEFTLATGGTLLLMSLGHASATAGGIADITIYLDDTIIYYGSDDYTVIRPISGGKHTLYIDAETDGSAFKDGPFATSAIAGASFQYTLSVPPKAYSTNLVGTVNLQDLASSPAGQIVRFDLVQAGQPIQSISARLDALGHYSIPTFVTGSADIFVRGTHWLRKKIGTVSISGASASLPAVSLTNGDVDGDNSVSILDYSYLSDAYDMTSADPLWLVVGVNGSRPDASDLDGDGGVTILDYSILSDEYDKSGA